MYKGDMELSTTVSVSFKIVIKLNISIEEVALPVVKGPKGRSEPLTAITNPNP
jgi:hypothetical protein